jgi:hypothetical protein
MAVMAKSQALVRLLLASGVLPYRPMCQARTVRVGFIGESSGRVGGVNRA